MSGLINANRALTRKSAHGSGVMRPQVTHGRNSTTGSLKDNHTGLTIDFCNIRGLSSNLDSVHSHLQISKPDLLFLTETQISQKFDINNLKFPSYDIITNLKFKGGVVCFYKNSVPLSHLFDCSTQHYQFSFFKISLPHHKKYICSVYRSPNTPGDSDFFSVLSNQILQLNPQPNDEIVLLGDFNVHNNSWLSFSGNTNVAGIECEAFASTHNFSQLIDFATRIPDALNQSSHTLDLFLTNFPHSYNIESFPPIGSSDHLLIRAKQRPSSGLSVKSSKVTVDSWLYDRADWDGLRNFYSEFPWHHFFNRSQPSITVTEITDIIKLGMETFIPKLSYAKNINSPKWFSKYCSIACNHKYKAFKKYIQTRTEASFRHYRHISNQTKATIKMSKNNYIHRQTNRLLNNPNDNKIFWSTLNSFNNNFNKHSSLPPLVTTDGTVYSDSKSKADLMASVFRTNSTLPQNDTQLPLVNFQYPNIKSIIIKTKEVKSILDNLDTNKSAGPDEIPPLVIKRCSPELAPIIAKLFRSIIQTSSFPDTWKQANIHPVPKKGNKSDPNNYRPIAITSILSKTFETLLNKHITNHLDTYNILNDKQYGFRKFRSTADLLIFLTNSIHLSLEGYGETHFTALDISKAFDRVWHAGLLSKIPHYGLSPISKVIESFLSDRQIRVVLDRTHSSWHNINSGVPQGSVLAPTLFLLNINDLLHSTANSIHSYADDSSLHRSFTFSKPPSHPELFDRREQTFESLNADLEVVSLWGNNNRTTFNSSKSQYIAFSNRTPIQDSSIQFIDSVIPCSTSIDVLGVKITKSLSWTEHIQNIYKTASQKLGLLYKTKPYFSDDQLLIIYKSHIRSQMEYCSPVWGGGGSVALGLLDRIQNRACRLINSPRLTQNLSSLQLRRDVASLSLFYRYYHGHCSQELSTMIPPPLVRRRVTRGTDIAHEHSLVIPTCRLTAYQDSFLPRAVKLWNSLTQSCFPHDYNPQIFKQRCSKYLSPVGIHF